MQTKKKHLSHIFPLIVLLSVTWTSARAQLNQGSLAGHVSDGSGAVVSHAHISARNTETGVVSTGESSDAGEFRFPALPLGTYDVSVVSEGFKTERFSKVLMMYPIISSLA